MVKYHADYSVYEQIELIIKNYIVKRYFIVFIIILSKLSFTHLEFKSDSYPL